MLAAYDREGWSPVPHALSQAPDLSVFAKIVYVVINSHIYAGRECIEISETKIAAEANCSWSQAHRGVRELRDLGWLEVEERSGKPSCYRLSNTYRPLSARQGSIGVPLPARQDTPSSQT